MAAILGGLIAALFFGASALLAQRSAWHIGGVATFGWSAVAGATLLAIPAIVASSSVSLTRQDVVLMVVAGIGNVVGLLLSFVALHTGRISVVVPIVSAEGAFGAVIACVFGATLDALTWAVLFVVACGVVLTSVNGADPDGRQDPAGDRKTVALSLAAGLVFAFGLYAQARLTRDVPLGLALAPPALFGVVLVTLPLLLLRRLPWNRDVPFALAVGAMELVGFVGYLLGSRDSIPIVAVLSSQYAAVAVLFSWLVLGERLVRLQVVGLVAIGVGVAALAVTTA